MHIKMFQKSVHILRNRPETGKKNEKWRLTVKRAEYETHKNPLAVIL